jgi:hypothetical protein
VYNSAPVKTRIELGATENGVPKLVAYRVLGDAQPGRNLLCWNSQCPWKGATLQWSPSLGAHSVTFHVLLIDTLGNVLMEADSTTFAVV